MAQNYVLFEIIGSTGGNALILNKNLVTGDSLEISNDGINWRAWQQPSTISISNPLYLRGNMPNGLNGYYFSFGTQYKVKVSGNIMALLDWENSDATVLTQERAFHELFKDCTAIQDASELSLPATTLSDTCYAKMFMGCTSLAAAPSLPATQLNQYCYASMFEGCTSLAAAPSLPATVMAKRCYSSMFTDSGLTVAPELPATTLAEGCYNCMFLRCSNITVAPLLPAGELHPYCYAHLFDGWSNLEVAPSLPASNLAAHCYDSMFADCSSLREAPYIGATTVADSACLYMFLRCTSLVKSPALQAKKLVSSCYQEMFAACTSLTEVTCLATSGVGENLTTYNWLRDRASLGVFICEGGTENLWSRDDSGVPANWTISPLPKVPRNIILQNLKRFHEKLKTETYPNLLTTAKTIVGAINELVNSKSRVEKSDTNGNIRINSVETKVYNDSDIRQRLAGFEKAWVIDDESAITGTKSSATGDYTNVTAISGITLSEMKVGDNVYVKNTNQPDFWVSQITSSVSLMVLDTKTDLSNYYNKTEVDTRLSNKVDKVSGKGLSTNDYTTTEKNKLAGIAAGAQVNTVTSVAGKTGAVTLAKSDVGLGSVVNTGDSATPVSGGTTKFTTGGAYTELAKKQDKLVSGTSIKTVNSTSLLGSGNIETYGINTKQYQGQSWFPTTYEIPANTLVYSDLRFATAFTLQSGGSWYGVRFTIPDELPSTVTPTFPSTVKFPVGIALSFFFQKGYTYEIIIINNLASIQKWQA